MIRRNYTSGEECAMQKLRLEYINKLLHSNLTGKEVDYILYISRFQQENGSVLGIYYKDVCSAMSFSSYQSFYNVQHSLEKKGLIKVKHNKEQGDFDVTLIGNDCSNITEVKQEGYINTNKEIFFSEKFLSLKGKEKLLFLYLLKRAGASGNRAFKELPREFFKTFQDMFHVTERVIRSYLKNLKKFFSIGKKDKYYWFRGKVGHGLFSTCHVSERERELEKIVSLEVRRAKIKDVKEQELKDTAKLFTQYKEDIIKLQNGGFITMGENREQGYFAWLIKEILVHKNLGYHKKKNIQNLLNPKFANKLTGDLIRKLQNA